jgi:uncharacterized membrane protein YccC
MASARAPLPPAPSTPSLWSRESSALKQGIKTGLSGTIAYAIYAGWHLPQGYWAVFAALVVTQANLGASWRAALYRTIGSTCGAIAAALLVPYLGQGQVGVGITLLILGSLFGYLTALHSAFTAAGFTAALILVFGGQGEPWHMAWLRVLYTILGAVVAFGVGALVWPVRARVGLRQKLANIVEGGGTLYRAVAAAALEGVDNEEEIQQLDRRLHDLRRGITQQMDEARSELAFSRFNRNAYSRFVNTEDLLRRRLTAMAEDRSLYVHARVEPGLLPSLPGVVEQTANLFSSIAQAVRTRTAPSNLPKIDTALHDLECDLSRLRAERATAPFALDRMLPFWALVFNLREVAQDLKQLESALPHLT